jgi:transcription termination/antitermination protein NusG
MTHDAQQAHRIDPLDKSDDRSPKWYVLWTRSQQEHLVFEQLSEKGFHLFLPTLEVWVRRNGNRHRAVVPMFPGYLFLNHAMDKNSYLDVTKARGLMRVLGERWDALGEVPAGEISNIRCIYQAGVPAMPYSYLQAGERVRIATGALEGVEGILVRTKLEKGLVVVSVNLLQRSVAVEIDCALVVPA